MKRSTPWCVGRLGQQPRAADVVLDRLAGVLLHQRHVLVRRGVEDDLRLVLREHGVDARRVGDVADDRDDGRTRAAGRRARCGWRGGCSRSARTSPATPAPSSAIWRHSSEPIEPPAPVTMTRRPRDQALERRRVEADRRARQQVLDREAADLLDVDACRRSMSRRFGSVLIGTLNGSSARTIGPDGGRVRAGNRDQHLVGPVPRDDALADRRRVPSTGTPWIRRPTLAGSSSTKPTGW